MSDRRGFGWRRRDGSNRLWSRDGNRHLGLRWRLDFGQIDQHEDAHVNLVTALQGMNRDGEAVDEGAVGGVQINQLVLVVFGDNDRVVLGDAAVVEMDGVVGRAANGADGAAKIVSARLRQPRQNVEFCLHFAFHHNNTPGCLQTQSG